MQRKKHMKTQHLTFQHPDADCVCVAGSFNDWSPDATPLTKNSEGVWAVDVALPSGRYEYRLVVDGVWLHDPNAAEFTPNPYGSLNSVLAAE
jgi:1,4-alpha-glucan branching enzyme